MKLHFASIIPMATAAVAVGIGISLLAATGFSPDGVVDNTWMTVWTNPTSGVPSSPSAPERGDRCFSQG